MIKFAEDLRDSLNEDEAGTLSSLAREPVIEVEGLPTHRVRMGKYRIFILIDRRGRRAVIVDVRHRREAYRR